MKRMNRWLMGLAMLGFVGGCLSAQTTESSGPFAVPSGPIAAHIRAVQDANDLAAADAAFAAGAAIDANNVFLNGTYMSKMVELGAPERAYAQARVVERADPTDGLALGVIAFAQARRGEMADALAGIILAAMSSPDDPFIVATAAQLAAWFDLNPDRPEIPGYVKDALADARKELAKQKLFTEAYDDAKAAYKELEAAAKEKAIAEAKASGEATPGTPETTQPEDYTPTYVAPAVPTSVTVNLSVYSTTYAEPAYCSPWLVGGEPLPLFRFDDFYRHCDRIVFLGRIRNSGFLHGFSGGRDVFIDKARNVFIGEARNVTIRRAGEVAIGHADKIVTGPTYPAGIRQPRDARTTIIPRGMESASRRTAAIETPAAAEIRRRMDRATAALPPAPTAPTAVAPVIRPHMKHDASPIAPKLPIAEPRPLLTERKETVAPAPPREYKPALLMPRELMPTPPRPQPAKVALAHTPALRGADNARPSLPIAPVKVGLGHTAALRGADNARPSLPIAPVKVGLADNARPSLPTAGREASPVRHETELPRPVITAPKVPTLVRPAPELPRPVVALPKAPTPPAPDIRRTLLTTPREPTPVRPEREIPRTIVTPPRDLKVVQPKPETPRAPVVRAKESTPVRVESGFRPTVAPPPRESTPPRREPEVRRAVAPSPPSSPPPASPSRAISRTGASINPGDPLASDPSRPSGRARGR